MASKEETEGAPGPQLRYPLAMGRDNALYSDVDMQRLAMFRKSEFWKLTERALDSFREFLLQEARPESATEVAVWRGELRVISHLLHNLPALVLECDRANRAAEKERG